LSHSKVRAEKICLNCGSPVPDRYCSACGQENIEPRQSVAHLITHFFSDFTHFDGKFFLTVKDLFRKPGFLSREYMRGRRMHYLDPIRMYIFTSAFFFIIFFSIIDLNSMHTDKVVLAPDYSTQTLKKVLEHAGNAEDSANIRKAFAEGPVQFRALVDSVNKGIRNFNITYRVSKYHSLTEYDSLQRMLPSDKRDGWLKRILNRKRIGLDEKYRSNGSAFLKGWLNIFTRNFPKFLFLSLPAFALLLKLLYVRRKQYYYVDHGIFAVHLYIYSFLLLLLYFGLVRLQAITGWDWMSWINLVLFLYGLWYCYRAMRYFYGQRRAKTMGKFVLLLILSLIVQLGLFFFYFLFSLLEL
jgi:hypothetical protein